MWVKVIVSVECNEFVSRQILLNEFVCILRRFLRGRCWAGGLCYNGGRKDCVGKGDC